MQGTTQPPALPAEFTEKMKALLGGEWEDFRRSYQNRRYQALRFYPQKKGLRREDYPALLGRLNVKEAVPVPWAEDAFYYEQSRGESPKGDTRPGAHPYHDMGLYYIQEPSAMSAAALLAPEPGERVLDLCAAPGGKTTQLASYMGQEGILVCNEIHPARCRILSQNIERMGIANAIVTNEDSGRLAERFPAFFDKILVDAPCSGEGMFRKNPEAVLEWSARQVKLCAERQSEILENAARMLKPGGRLVYSTCTFSPEENERVIAAFLAAHPAFALVETDAPHFSPGRPEWADGNPQLARTFRLWPHRLCGEGHFAAVLKRDAADAEKKTGFKGKKGKADAAAYAALREFLDETCERGTADWIMRGELTLFGEQLYRLPEEPLSLSGLRVLRAGLHIGTLKKNRLEPSHALALFLGKSEVKNAVDLALEDPAAAAFFRGEALSSEGKKGWCLVCVDGFSAGWGKRAGKNLKNHYPKGLRR